MSEPMTDYHTSFVSLEKRDAPHSPGHKADANKVRPRLVMEGFPLALTAVAEVATFGANKYCEGGWAHVPNGIHRYSDALYRHLLKAATGELRDPESGLLHHAHAAWNALVKSAGDPPLDLALLLLMGALVALPLLALAGAPSPATRGSVRPR